MMRAAVITGPGALRIDEVPKPEPGPGQVRIRLEGCGVCASNLTPWAGPEWMRFPTGPGALGHEAWGYVDAVGTDVAGLREGDRVGAATECSYAEYDVADAGKVVPLPRALDGIAFPAEPFACAMNIFRRADIEAGQNVAILGIGFLGAILTRLAAEAGAAVIAISRRPCSLALARAMGAAATIEMDDHQAVIDRVDALTDGALCPRTIEAVGKAWPLDLAAEVTGDGGRLIVAGYHQDGPRQVNMQLWNWRGFDVINAHERDPAVIRRGMAEAVAAAVEGRIEPAPLLTHSYPLEALGEALDATRDRPPGFVKAMVTFP
ncbi:MAG: hypothetical protein QOH81_1640 [Sphingomonadales bacterium]|jgi:threonine dehydrogenase-like Zn-dependent dehydrogenase|nr:hypothetical protein [Sphingomonadales bacterium]